MKRGIFTVLLIVLCLTFGQQVNATVQTTASTMTFNGSGSTGPFTFNFPFLENADIAVYKTVSAVTVLLVETVDYTLTGAGSSTGGAVTLNVALNTGETIKITRVMPLTQSTAFKNLGAFFPQLHENAFDRLTMIAQQLSANPMAPATYVSATSASKYGTDLSQAIAAIGSGSATVVVDSPITVLTSLTVPSNITLVVNKPGIITVSSGQTITINGPFSAGLYQAFAGSGVVTFGSGAVSAVYPQWWGAAITLTDNTQYIYAALNAFPVVDFAGNTYKTTGTILPNSNNTLRNGGIDCYCNSTPAISMNSKDSVTFNLMTVTGANTTGEVHGLYGTQNTNLKIVDSSFSNFPKGCGIYITQTSGLTVSRVTANNNSTVNNGTPWSGVLLGYNTASANSLTDAMIDGLTAIGNGYNSQGHGLYISGKASQSSYTDNVRVVNSLFKTNYGAGIHLNDVGKHTVIANNNLNGNKTWGIVSVGGNGIIINANEIVSTGASPTNDANSSGIYLNSCTNTIVAGNMIDTVTAGSGMVVTITWSGISSNTIKSAGLFGIIMTSSGSIACNISNNTIRGSGRTGIYLGGGTAPNQLSGVTVANNNCSNNGMAYTFESGIYYSNVIRSTFTGNTLYDDQATHTQSYGIASDTSVSAYNTVSDNNAYNNLSANYASYDRGLVVDGKTGYMISSTIPTIASVTNERVLNSYSTVGQPKAWVYTGAGSWVSEGNL